MCGLTRTEDIALAVALGVDAIGLNFASQSSRCISVTHAKQLLLKLPLFVDIVAVLVNPSIAFVNEILQELPISWLQFHGDESPEFCDQFNKPYIKAIPANSTETIYHSCTQYRKASAILLDTPSQQYGGTGQCFDWSLIPRDSEKPFILAGGLNPINVKEAVQLAAPYAVDVASGIESTPGIKDHEKMRQFVQALWGKV